MNPTDALRVAARGSAFPISDRKLGSANGNRTCIVPVQSSSVRSKSVQTRSVRTERHARKVAQSAGVPARCQRGQARVGTESRPQPPSALRPLTASCADYRRHNGDALGNHIKSSRVSTRISQGTQTRVSFVTGHGHWKQLHPRIGFLVK